ncbi:ORF1 [Plasmodium vivax Narna-Like virus 1]|nr:ORF1 [Plasmodium vivax Narna-Like virus 1]
MAKPRLTQSRRVEREIDEAAELTARIEKEFLNVPYGVRLKVLRNLCVQNGYRMIPLTSSVVSTTPRTLPSVPPKEAGRKKPDQPKALSWTKYPKGIQIDHAMRETAGRLKREEDPKEVEILRAKLAELKLQRDDFKSQLRLRRRPPLSGKTRTTSPISAEIPKDPKGEDEGESKKTGDIPPERWYDLCSSSNGNKGSLPKADNP